MEKRTPHYPLARVRALLEAGHYRVTESAQDSAANHFCIIDLADIAAVVMRLKRTEFVKSMTTYSDMRVWQDVYCPHIETCPAYVKIQIAHNETVVISFKRWESN